MTVAVCLKCGVMKWGAWVPCPECHHEPTSHEDMARHVMVSDHFLSKQELEAVSVRLKSGEPISFDEAQVRLIAQEYARMPSMRSCSAVAIGSFVLLLLLIIVTCWLVFR